MGNVLMTKVKAISAKRLTGSHRTVSGEDKSLGVVREVTDVSGERAGAFDEALTWISVGERIIYHIGEHCAGAHRRAARSAYESGVVTLSLRKRAKHQFEYIAIKIAECC